MEADGLVLRRPDESDGRRTLVEMTDNGLTLLRRDRAQRDGWLSGAIAQLSRDDQELLARSVALLERLSTE
jgi:DNA-binding MarR family transcriptional regulator